MSILYQTFDIKVLKELEDLKCISGNINIFVDVIVKTNRIKEYFQNPINNELYIKLLEYINPDYLKYKNDITTIKNKEQRYLDLILQKLTSNDMSIVLTTKDFLNFLFLENKNKKNTIALMKYIENTHNVYIYEDLLKFIKIDKVKFKSRKVDKYLLVKKLHYVLEKISQ